MLGVQVWTVFGTGRRAAAATSRRPAPANFTGRGEIAPELADDISSAFTWSGVSPGRACSSSATAPDTTAAAWDEPLPLNSRSST